VIAALALAACQTPTEPDLAAAQPAFSAASAPIVVAGSGHIDADPTDPHDLRRFTISAIGHADGTASGQYQLTIGPAAVTAHGTVTCVSTLGNRAFIGGTIDRRNIFEEFDITGVAIEVVDNGVGGGDVSPDEVSSVGFFVANPDGPQQFCDAATPGPTMPITQGDITVR
jgi:hypothetical protein